MKRTHAEPRTWRKIFGALFAMVAISFIAQMIPPWGSVALILFFTTIGCVLGGALLLEIYHRLRQATDILHPYPKGLLASGLIGTAAALIVLKLPMNAESAIGALLFLPILVVSVIGGGILLGYLYGRWKEAFLRRRERNEQ